MAFKKPPTNEVELIQQVGMWSKYNFSHRRAPHFGIVEEVGEAAHCVLKRIQEIRGFNKYDFFIKEFSDALADAIIYLADWCFDHNSFFNFGRNLHIPRKLTTEDQNRILCHILQATAVILQHADREPSFPFSVVNESDYNMVAQRICTGIEMWAQVYDIDLRLIVANTWAKVSQRDWTKNVDKPAEGLE